MNFLSHTRVWEGLVLTLSKCLVELTGEAISTWIFLTWEILITDSVSHSKLIYSDFLVFHGSFLVNYMFLEIYPFLRKICFLAACKIPFLCFQKVLLLCVLEKIILDWNLGVTHWLHEVGWPNLPLCLGCCQALASPCVTPTACTSSWGWTIVCQQEYQEDKSQWNLQRIKTAMIAIGSFLSDKICGSFLQTCPCDPQLLLLPGDNQ